MHVSTPRSKRKLPPASCPRLTGEMRPLSSARVVARGHHTSSAGQRRASVQYLPGAVLPQAVCLPLSSCWMPGAFQVFKRTAKSLQANISEALCSRAPTSSVTVAGPRPGASGRKPANGVAVSATSAWCSSTVTLGVGPLTASPRCPRSMSH